MRQKDRNYYVEWWNVKKSIVYGIAAAILFLGLGGFGGWWLYKSDWLFSNKESAQIPKDAARLISFEGDVRITRAATRETILVTRPTYLLAGDTIQTQADGKAQVQMIDGSTLSVRPNSTVVIRDSSTMFGGQNVRVAVDTGQINVKTEDQQESTNNVVEVKQSENKLLSQTDASFGVNPTTNGGEIRISRGGVETSIGGEKTIIREGEFATVNPNGKLSARERLFPPPKLIAPAPLEKAFAAPGGTSDISFRWQKPDESTNFMYRMEVSTSPFFLPNAMVLEREPLANPNLSLQGLTPGNYFWRVRAVAASGQTSEWSEPSKFTVVKREGGDDLSASDWQIERVGGNIFLISGKARPGLTVRILGRETFAASDGTFRLQVSTPASEVTVEISDEHGNRNRMVLSLTAGRVVR
jgi:hypothetical protein